MYDPQTALLSRFLMVCVTELADDAAQPDVWARATAALGGTREKEVDLAAAIDAKDAKKLAEIVEAWASKNRPLPEHDVEIMRRALKAFMKTLKLTQLDAESKLGKNPMTNGRASSIVGIVPPIRFSRDVWDELVRQGQLRGGRQGIYELPPG